jgi:hypothetical protein
VTLKRGAKKDIAGKTWNVVGSGKNGEATLVWGLFTFHLSWMATSGKKLAARILRHMSSMHAYRHVLKPPKSDAN